MADVLFCFQTAPGVNNSVRIDPGPATLVGPTPAAVHPVNNGYFGFKMAEDSSVDFMVFDTTYRIFHHKEPDLEPPSGKGIIPIHIWTYLGPWNSVSRIQRQLQLLGYYLGKVDDIYGEKTERAILWFQADLGLRTDGEFNAVISTKVDDFIDHNNRTTGGIYIARRMLIRFARAPLAGC